MRNQHPLIPIAAAACLCLAGCGGLLQSEEPVERTFWLTPLEKPALDAAAAAISLSVGVQVVPGLDTDKMLTLTPQAELNHFGGARWPDHLPEFAGSLLRRSLRSSGRFDRVVSEQGARSGDCVLSLLINRFYTVLDGAGSVGSVQIAMSGDFTCGEGARQFEVDSSHRVAGSGLAEVVAAHQRAMDEVTEKLLPMLSPLLSPPVPGDGAAPD